MVPLWCVLTVRRALSPLQSEQQLDCALDLMRRLPPQNIEENLAGLIDLVWAAAALFSPGHCHHLCV